MPYFPNASGLNQHLRHQHPEIAKQAKLAFDRAQHSLFGVPMCRYCHQRCSTWASLTKHFAQGHCITVKTALLSGITPAQLHQQTIEEELARPPIPPSDALVKQEPYYERMRLQDMAQNSYLLDSSQEIHKLAKTCAICGQTILTSIHIKSHCGDKVMVLLGIFANCRHNPKLAA